VDVPPERYPSSDISASTYGTGPESRTKADKFSIPLIFFRLISEVVHTNRHSIPESWTKAGQASDSFALLGIYTFHKFPIHTPGLTSKRPSKSPFTYANWQS
jgi:hypothetical protein